MFIIQKGRVQLTRNLRGVEKILAVLPAGEFFGEMAIINQKPRSATATVIAESHLLVLDQPTFEKMIKDNTEIAVRLIKKLAARLEQANFQVELLLLKDVNHRIVHLLRRMAEETGVREVEGVRIDISIYEVADRIGCDDKEVADIVDRLARARLLKAQQRGFVIPEVGRLQDFLEFLEMKDRFAGQG
ncbi:MAG: Crp/Fnr family transcriptional regulator [Deltaproteobacteria bacterium]|nr:Crp/Fnr family transcriptional regulator [Deltaproteobacteria bacterium]